MQPCTPAPSLSRYVQSLHGMNKEIKLIVFLKMMKKIAQKFAPDLTTRHAASPSLPGGWVTVEVGKTMV